MRSKVLQKFFLSLLDWFKKNFLTRCFVIFFSGYPAKNCPKYKNSLSCHFLIKVAEFLNKCVQSMKKWTRMSQFFNLQQYKPFSNQFLEIISPFILIGDVETASFIRIAKIIQTSIWNAFWFVFYPMLENNLKVFLDRELISSLIPSIKVEMICSKIGRYTRRFN